MITLEMCLDYIEHSRIPSMFADMFRTSIQLTKSQKKFLKNLCEGKLTDTPRCFGKTFIIKLYCECLNYYSDAIKYGGAVADDYISLNEFMDDFKELDMKPLDMKSIAKGYKIAPEIAMREYNFEPTDIECYL